MVAEGGILFPASHADRDDARMLVHPPGYAILIRASYREDEAQRSYTLLRIFQIICDSGSAVMVCLIAAALMNNSVGIIAGLGIAISPHLAYYSLWLTPDSMAVLPILMAVYLIILSISKHSPRYSLMAGICIGLSCWLRANALLLAPFLGVVIAIIQFRKNGIRQAAVMIAATLLVVAPITIRNSLVFHRFVPFSIHSGLVLIEGIADYDVQDRFNLPATDTEAKYKDVEWSGREDYAESLWGPDGITRDKVRLARGLGVVKSHPLWFMGVIARRAAFMVRYDEWHLDDKTYITSGVPKIAPEASFMRPLDPANYGPAVLSISPGDLIKQATVVASQAQVVQDENDERLFVTGNGSDYGKQLVSAAIGVEPYTDYLVTIPAALLDGGQMAVSIVSQDGHTGLSSGVVAPIATAGHQGKRAAKRGIPAGAPEDGDPRIVLPFSSGACREVRLVLSNNGPATVQPQARFGETQMFRAGHTRYAWTRYPRMVLRGLQRNLINNLVLYTLIVMGIILMILTQKGRSLIILLAVPAYYVCTQSALHTEYRYILAIHYFLFVIAGFTLWVAGAGTVRLIRKIAPSIVRTRGRPGRA